MMTETGTATSQVFIRNELGLHARPAAILAKEAGKFDSTIQLVLDNVEVDAKSVLDILSLAAVQGKTITIKAAGPDAETAVAHLEHFFQDGFGES
jgi:phosphocarrier protein